MQMGSSNSVRHSFHTGNRIVVECTTLKANFRSYKGQSYYYYGRLCSSCTLTRTRRTESTSLFNLSCSASIKVSNLSIHPSLLLSSGSLLLSSFKVVSSSSSKLSATSIDYVPLWSDLAQTFSWFYLDHTASRVTWWQDWRCGGSNGYGWSVEMMVRCARQLQFHSKRLLVGFRQPTLHCMGHPELSRPSVSIPTPALSSRVARNSV